MPHSGIQGGLRNVAQCWGRNWGPYGTCGVYHVAFQVAKRPELLTLSHAEAKGDVETIRANVRIGFRGGDRNGSAMPPILCLLSGIVPNGDLVFVARARRPFTEAGLRSRPEGRVAHLHLTLKVDLGAQGSIASGFSGKRSFWEMIPFKGKPTKIAEPNVDH